MNPMHLYLLISHLPIFGSILGGFVLACGLWAKSDRTKIAAYYVLIGAVIGAGIAYLTREAAEGTVENIPGIAKNMIDQHEDFAVFALVFLTILGIGSVVGLFLTLKKSWLTRPMAIAVLFISLIGFGMSTRTGYLGGQTRHTEINNTTASTQEPEGESEGDD